MAHVLEITSAFEFAVLTLTVPGLRFRKYQNPLCFRVSAPFSSSLTAEFRIILLSTLYRVVLSILLAPHFSEKRVQESAKRADSRDTKVVQ
jgi:hypothetical protein